MRRQKRRNGKNILIPALLTAAVVTATGGGLSYLVLSEQGKAMPDKQGCYPGIPKRHIHMVVDVSNPRYDDEQQRGIYRYAEQLYDRMEPNEKLSVYSSEGNQVASIAKSKFSICGQANTSEELADMNAVESSPGYLKKQKQRLYQTRFYPKLKALLTDKFSDEQKAKSSPIMEMLADLSRQPTIKARSKLILISDLFQNSATVKPFCLVKNALPPFSAYSQWPVYKSLLKPQSLAGVEVEILMLQRPTYGNYCTERELRQWWVDYFKENAGQEPSVIRIRAGG